MVVWLHDYGFVCPRMTYFYRGASLCTGPSYAKCVTCASGQYGAPQAFALTTGLMAMKRWQRRVDRYFAVSRFTADTSAALLDGGPRTMDVIPNFIPEDAFQENRPRPDFVPPEGSGVRVPLAPLENRSSAVQFEVASSAT